MSDLKTIRLEKGLTQIETSERSGVYLRSYVTYENDENRSRTPKYRFLVHEMSGLNPVDEEYGILLIEVIIKKCTGRQGDVAFVEDRGTLLLSSQDKSNVPLYLRQKQRPPVFIHLQMKMRQKG